MPVTHRASYTHHLSGRERPGDMGSHPVPGPARHLLPPVAEPCRRGRDAFTRHWLIPSTNTESPTVCQACAIHGEGKFSKQKTHILKKLHSSWGNRRQTEQAVSVRCTSGIPAKTPQSRLCAWAWTVGGFHAAVEERHSRQRGWVCKGSGTGLCPVCRVL